MLIVAGVGWAGLGWAGLQVDVVHEIFDALDVDHDGSICKQELLHSLAGNKGHAPSLHIRKQYTIRTLCI